MGSVLVLGSTIVFRASSMVGWVVVMVFLPPPFLRHLPIGGDCLKTQISTNLTATGSV